MACSLCRQVKLGRKGKKRSLPFRVISKAKSGEDEEKREIAESKDSTTSQWVDLPFEIISDIFSRLPIKSLLRCRLVFKHWNLLTHTSQFINLYHMARISRQPLTFAFPSIRFENGLNSLFVFQKDEETIRIPFEHKLQGRSYYVYSSCNGFLLLRDTKSRIRECTTPITPKFIIYNPITKETILNIPDPPTDTYYPVSFGFDAKTNQHKLVLQHDYIITLGQICWRKLSTPCKQKLDTSGGSVFINGALYWRHTTKDVIISLDICTEKYRIIQGVEKSLEDAEYCLLEYDNKLAYIVFDFKSQQLEIWSLEDNQYNTWILLFTDNISHLLSKHYCKQHKYRFEQQVGSDSLLFYHLDAGFNHEDPDEYDLRGEWWYRLFIYTPKPSGGHVINFTTNRLECWSFFDVFHFVPNLSLLQNPDRLTKT